MEIDINSVEGFRIGNAQNVKAATGCTAIIAKDGAVCGVATYGGAPASRETELLRSEKMVQSIHCVMLCGGSAYGLDAAGGAMAYLEEKNIGFNVGKGVVPIVCAASIFDLNIGNFNTRPNKEMGYLACKDSENSVLLQGNYGAGTGACVGKCLGNEQSMKSGLGFYAEEIDGIQIGALVALNALGDIFENGKKIAGVLNEKFDGFLDTEKLMLKNIAKENNLFENTNTTIACIITNAKLTKPEANRLASLAHDAYARSIRPVHTAFDGDTIFAMGSGKVVANAEVVAIKATEILEKAIVNAVKHSDSAYGLKSYSEIFS